MKKFTKWAGASVLILALVSLIRKGYIKETSAEISDLRQLTNRLIEQTKGCKNTLSHLTTSFRKVNLAQIQNHLNDFNRKISPKINKIQAKSTQLKKDFKH